MSINEKKPFKQGNTLQNERMKSWLKERLAKNVTLQKVVELFCGSGNFTEIIAQSNCASVIAYESDESAIKALQHKQLPKVTAHTYDLFKPFAWRDLQKNGCEADTLVLDPPRSGLKNIRFLLRLLHLKQLTIFLVIQKLSRGMLGFLSKMVG